MIDAVTTSVGRMHSRWQFSLRAMFLLTLSTAALAAIGRVAAQLDVLVVGVASAIWSTRGVVRIWRRTRAVSALSLLMMALSWSMFYVVSIGPAILIAESFAWTKPAIKTLYGPLDWAFVNTPLRDALGWYVVFWHELT